jgi:hypothetical protein
VSVEAALNVDEQGVATLDEVAMQFEELGQDGILPDVLGGRFVVHDSEILSQLSRAAGSWAAF